jgi:Domain of unknown function (DUF1737)
MDWIEDYEVVHRDSPREMTEKVREMIARGWQPVGPVQPILCGDANGSTETVSYFQTMVKYAQPNAGGQGRLVQ